LQGILSSGSTSPKIFAFNDEASLRVYKSNPNYTQPAVAEDLEVRQWFHVALTNKNGYSRLFVDGELKDKVRSINMDWTETINIGYALTNFSGYIQSFRVTYGVSRYNLDFTPPNLPLTKN
jgi:hypothetical protein